MTELDTRAEQVFERIDDAFFALDEEWRFTYLNGRAAEMLDVDRDAVIGNVVWDEFEPAVGTTFQQEYERAMERQEPVSFEEYYEPLSTWFEVTAYPGEDGLSVYFRDVTDRVERERELEHYRSVVETATDGIYVVENGEFTMVNEAYTEMVGYEREALLGEPVTKVVDEETAERAARLGRELGDGNASTASVETTFERDDGRRIEAEATFSLLPDGSRIGVVRDITERKERERALKRYQRVIETVDDGVYVVDGDDHFTMVNDAFCELAGYDRRELLGSSASTLYDADVAEAVDELLAEMQRGERDEAIIELELERKDGSQVPVETRFDRIAYGDGLSRCGVVRDISERKRFEERLLELHEVATELFHAEVASEVAQVATNALHDILDAPAAAFLSYDADSNELVPSVVSDRGPVVQRDASSVPADEGSVTGSVFQSGESKLVSDVSEEPKIPYTDLGVQSGVVASVGDHGVLLAAAGEVDAFDSGMERLVDIVATSAGAAIDQVERERELKRQRDRLSALGDIDSLVHSLSESMFGLSSREEIEALVCDRLSASDSYEFAWIGHVDDGEVTVAEEAGVEGYLDDLLLDGTGEEPPGPTVQAHRTERMQVVQDVQSDPRYDSWREHASTNGYRSSASVPIVDGGEVQGTLNVYSSRADAFDEEERDALRRLGAIVAYAISSVQRDRALHRERNRLEFMNRLLRHNLLNDLNVVNARLELLEGRVDYEMADHLEVAADRAQEMVEFVERVRDVTKVIGSGDEQDLEPKSLGEVLESRVARAQSAYTDAEYHIEDAPDVEVVADDLLGEVLDNVLQNAAQHNPGDDPTVWVDTTVGEETVVLSVADDGPGIPDDRKSVIFDRESAEFENPGSGFGLYLVEEILDSYGGDITVEDSEADGSLFRLTFPRA